MAKITVKSCFSCPMFIPETNEQLAQCNHPDTHNKNHFKWGLYELVDTPIHEHCPLKTDSITLRID